MAEARALRSVLNEHNAEALGGGARPQERDQERQFREAMESPEWREIMICVLLIVGEDARSGFRLCIVNGTNDHRL